MKWSEAYEYSMAHLEEYEAYQDEYLIPTHVGKSLGEKIAREQQRIKASQAVNDAVRHGTLERKPCEVCGQLRTEGHHPDYSKPLEVRWLCPDHHRAEHKRLKAKAKK